MSKRPKKSNREARKPKQDKPKAEATSTALLGAGERSTGNLSAGKKKGRG